MEFELSLVVLIVWVYDYLFLMPKSQIYSPLRDYKDHFLAEV